MKARQNKPCVVNSKNMDNEHKKARKQLVWNSLPHKSTIRAIRQVVSEPERDLVQRPSDTI
jgi:hypothetical protein